MQLHAPSFVFGNLAGSLSKQNFYPGSSVGQQRHTDEVRHLKLIIERLSSKLREYQLRCGDESSLDVQSQEGSQPSGVASMLSSHLLGPLFLEYEAVQRQLERELRAKEAEVQR